MNTRQWLNGAAMTAALALAACSAPGPQQPASGGYPGYSSYHGTVESVETIRESGQSSGAGAVIGGVAGGVLGHQVGSGSGNTAATIGGAVAGAVVGNEVEKRRNANETYRFRVRMDDGSIQTFTQDTPSIRTGDRVRMEDGRISRY